jgi:small subunit ribosomal protein S18
MLEENRQEVNSEQDGYLKISLVNQGMSIRKKRVCPLKDVAKEEINYKNLKLLSKYISERGKILPSRVTGVCVKKQRILSQAIKRARNLALLSFIAKNED